MLGVGNPHSPAPETPVPRHLTPDTWHPISETTQHPAPSARFRWVAVATLAVLLGACEQSSSAPDFFPLHIDDTWVYEVGQPLRNRHLQMTVRVRGNQFVKPLGRSCDVVEESYGASQAAEGTVERYPIAYYRDGDFLHRVLSLEYRNGEVAEAGLDSFEERFLPLGLAATGAWEGQTRAYALGPENDYRVLQKHRALHEDSEITVPAGRFRNCIRVDTTAVHATTHDGQPDGAPMVLYYSDWYAPNVGLIQSVQHSRADGGPPLAEIQLLAYDVSGAK